MMPSQSLTTDDTRQTDLYVDGPSIINDYKIVSGEIAIPVAEEPPDDLAALQVWSPVIILKLHSPYRIRKARFLTKKQSAPPIAPSPISTGAFTFLSGSFITTNTPNTANGYDWGVDCIYTYVENCVSRTEDGFVLGVPGFLTANQQDYLASGGGVPVVPPFGAIYQAGDDAKIGWLQGILSLTPILPFGIQLPYSNISYYPGLFFNDNLMNASLSTPVTPPYTPGNP